VLKKLLTPYTSRLTPHALRLTPHTLYAYESERPV